MDSSWFWTSRTLRTAIRREKWVSGRYDCNSGKPGDVVADPELANLCENIRKFLNLSRFLPKYELQFWSLDNLALHCQHSPCQESMYNFREECTGEDRRFRERNPIPERGSYVEGSTTRGGAKLSFEKSPAGQAGKMQLTRLPFPRPFKPGMNKQCSIASSAIRRRAGDYRSLARFS